MLKSKLLQLLLLALLVMAGARQFLVQSPVSQNERDGYISSTSLEPSRSPSSTAPKAEIKFKRSQDEPSYIPEVVDTSLLEGSILKEGDMGELPTVAASVTPTATPSAESSRPSQDIFSALAGTSEDTAVGSQNVPREQQLDNNRGRVGGYRAPATASDDPPPASPSPSPGLSRLTGQARGYTMLYLMHPHARAAVDKQIEILKKSEIHEVYLGVLVDGTFSIDYDYLTSVVYSLNQDGRQLTLVLYLTNGATMRRHDETSIDAGFNLIEPSIFRTLIKEDRQTQSAFQAIARDAIPILEYNKSLNELNQNYVIVMLEDNLDVESYEVMRRLAYQVIGDRASYMRNPCPDCYEGNDMDALGDPVEYHYPFEAKDLSAGDGYSLDGKGLRFSSDASASSSSTVSPEYVKQQLDIAKSNKAAFYGLWRAERQGIENNKIVHPDVRNYEIPTDEQADVEIGLLRHGLTELQR